MRFLFRLDLSLHAGAGIFFGILIFETKHGVTDQLAVPCSPPATNALEPRNA